jgi:LysM repeat protein
MPELTLVQPTGRSGSHRNRHRIAVVVALTLTSFAASSWPARPVGAAPAAAAKVVPNGRLSGLRYHEVLKGESLASIAKKYALTPDVIRSANGMAKDTVYLGARLLLDEPNPGRMTPPAGGAPAAAATYTVVSGDTLAKISKRNGTTIAALVDANHLKSANQIRIGQVLTIAAAGPAGPVCPVAGSTFAYDWGFPRADGARFHEGIDMFAPLGTPILAPVDGAVTYGTSSISGKFATLKGANGWQYFSAHLSKTAKGGNVKAGDVIGFVGNTGDAKGGATHLHLEIRPLDGRPINPFPVVSAACAPK